MRHRRPHASIALILVSNASELPPPSYLKIGIFFSPKAMTECSTKIDMMPSPVDKLSEELIVEILSRVPYKSLCRSKCVSRRWRGVISHPDHRKLLAQYHLDVFAGFLSSSYQHRLGLHYFSSASMGGRAPIDPALRFLPDHHQLSILDSCNGLLLCRYFKSESSFSYVVCNPATEKWVALPGSFDKMHTARLGFDPAVSSHFNVFHFVENGTRDVYGYMDDNSDGDVKGVYIYSSKTGVWNHKNSGWDRVEIDIYVKGVFANGVLYLVAIEYAVLAVDVEGDAWRVIPMPHEDSPFKSLEDCGFIDLSQGHLHFANTDHEENTYKLSIWVLEDCSSEQWILKHTVRYMNLFGVKNADFGRDYIIVGIHPEQNTIFLVYGPDKLLMSYEMDSRKVCFMHNIGPDFFEPFLPYAPLYSESLADG